MTKDDLWQLVLGELEISLSRANFLTWFQKTFLAEKKDGVAVISVPNAFAKEWLETKYRRFLLKSLRSHDNEVKDVHFVIGKAIQKEERAGLPKERSSAVLSLPLQHSQVDRETNLKI